METTNRFDTIHSGISLLLVLQLGMAAIALVILNQEDGKYAFQAQ